MEKQKKAKKIKRNFIAAALISLISVPALFLAVNANVIENKTTSKLPTDYSQNLISSSLASTTTLKAEHRAGQEIVIIKDGPITYEGNTFRLLDWFGEPIWEFDLEKELLDRGLTDRNGVGNRADVFGLNKVFVNFTYNKKNNTLYILTLASRYYHNVEPKVPQHYQYIIPLDLSTGKMPPGLETRDLKYIDVTPHTRPYWDISAQFTKISMLGNGDVAIYYLNGTSGLSNGAGADTFIYNPINNTIRKIRMLGITNNHFAFNIYMFGTKVINIIPISENLNFVVTQQVGGRREFPAGGQGSGRGSIFVLLAKSDLSSVDPQRSKPLNYKEAIFMLLPFNKGWQGGVVSDREAFGYNPSYFVNPISGIIQFVIYDYMYFVKPDPTNQRGYTFTKVKLPQIVDDPSNTGFVYSNSGVMFSGQFDLLGDFYFNMSYWKNNREWSIEPTIYRLRLQNNVPSISTFINLNNSGIPDIDNQIDKFKIYPVPGQVGKLFLINTETGITIAISQDPKNPNIGKILGTLNGDSNFVVRPGFNLKSHGQFLLPSELEKTDFKSNGENDLLSGFKVQSISDQTGNITVRASIKYLPWFEGNSSINYRILEETKSFSGLKTIDSLSSWKNNLSNKLSTSLTKFITKQDIIVENPFIINADLKNINVSDTADGYNIISANPILGEITLGHKIRYTPNLDENGPEQVFAANPKVYKVAKDIPGAYQLTLFGGKALVNNVANTSNGVVNIANFSTLAQFTKKNILPSDIEANKNLFFQYFIDAAKTQGYPIFSLNPEMNGNDQTGELEVTINVPPTVNSQLGFPSSQTSIKAKFSGFNKVGDYKFDLSKFKTSQNSFSDYMADIKELNDESKIGKYGSQLPSQITIDEIINDILNVTGFAKDEAYSISLLPDDSNGLLQVNIRLLPEFQKLRTGTIFQPALNNNVKLTLKGFRSIQNINEKSSFVIFAEKNNPILLEYTKKIPSNITITDAFRLFSLNNGNTFGAILPKNVTLFPNDILGTLSILIDLSVDINDFENIGTNGVKLPKLFLVTYTGFSNLKSGDYDLRLLQNEQLEASIDIKNLTAQYIFNNISKFILVNKGYQLSSAEQIRISKNEFLKAIFVSFDFTNNPNIPNGIPKKFSVIYKY